MLKRTAVIGYGKLHQAMEQTSQALARSGQDVEAGKLKDKMVDSLRKRRKALGIK